jgi:hypothetical protein
MKPVSIRTIFSVVVVVFVALIGCAVPVSANAQTEVPIYTSSIQVPTGAPTDEQHLLSFAKIRPDEARAAGLAYYNGDFKYVKIHSLAGNLVYEVEFQDGLELIIDAGNKLLLQVKLEKNSVLDRARRAMKQ